MPLAGARIGVRAGRAKPLNAIEFSSGPAWPPRDGRVPGVVIALAARRL